MANVERRRFYDPDRASRWQDWANVVLAVWLFISPWVLSFGHAAAPAAPGANGAAPVAAASSGVAAWDAWVLAVIIFLFAISAMGRLALWQEWVNLLLGIWVFIAPWVLGFVHLNAAAWDHWIVGVLVFLVSLSAMTMLGGSTGVHAPPSGGTTASLR